MMDTIYTLVLPLLSVAIFGLLGFLRGAMRESFVAGSIALAALMSEMWGGRWGIDLNTMVPGIGQGPASFYVVLAMMVLTVLVVGYALGSSVVRGKAAGTSRLLGLLLGLVNGAAFAGWLMRAAFVHLDASSAASPLYTDLSGRTFMIIAAWFPVALALIGAIVALFRALRGGGERPAEVAAVPTAAPIAAAPQYPQYAQRPYEPAQSWTAASGTGYAGAPPAQQSPPPYEPQRQAGPNPLAAYATVSTPPPETPAELAGTPPSGTQLPARPVAAEAPEMASETRVIETAGDTALPKGEARYYTPPLGVPAVIADSPAEEAKAVERHNAETEAVAAAPALEERRCKACGNRVEPGQVFCTQCGTRAG